VLRLDCYVTVVTVGLYLAAVRIFGFLAVKDLTDRRRT